MYDTKNQKAIYKLKQRLFGKICECLPKKKKGRGRPKRIGMSDYIEEEEGSGLGLGALAGYRFCWYFYNF